MNWSTFWSKGDLQVEAGNQEGRVVMGHQRARRYR